MYSSIIVSFIIFPCSLCGDFSKLNNDAKKGIRAGVFCIEILSMLTVITINFFHYFNYDNTDYSDYPWIKLYYIIGIFTIIIAKCLILLSAVLFFAANLKIDSHGEQYMRPDVYIYSRLPIHRQ